MPQENGKDLLDAAGFLAALLANFSVHNPQVRGLSLTHRCTSFLDQRPSPSCVGLVLEAEHDRISPSHHLGHHEAQIDPRITKRFRQGMAEPLPIVPLDQQGRHRCGRQAGCLGRRHGLPAGHRM
jgi:hypothetical protein